MQTDTRVHKAKWFVVGMVLVGLIGVESLNIQPNCSTSSSEYFSSGPAAGRVEEMNPQAVVQSSIGDLYYNYYQAQAVVQANLALAQWWH